jgi:hypothetical protein
VRGAVVRSLVLGFLLLGLVDAGLPFFVPAISPDWTDRLLTFSFWVERAAAIPLILGLEAVCRQRLWLRLLAHFALLEALAQISGLTYFYFAGGEMVFHPLWSAPLMTPNLVMLYATVVGTAAVIRHRVRRAEEEIAEERLLADGAQRSLLAMRAEVRSGMILAALLKIEGMLASDPAAAERAITRFSDFLLLGMRRIGHDFVPLELELRFAAATIDMAALLDDHAYRTSIPEPVPAIDCEPGELFDFIEQISAAVRASSAADVRLEPRRTAGGAVTVDAHIVTAERRMTFTHAVQDVAAEVGA